MPTAQAAPPIELDAEDEETADETIVGSLSDVLRGARDDDDDDFDLLVDDEVLELGGEGDGAAGADGTEPPEAATERRGGLISRILGRK
ncbi:MAG: hypothetical protein KF729_36675 [Sandaracinaceae bacterium]|nr:hypothetical protein [Sandaracinaceae bacterium]